MLRRATSRFSKFGKEIEYTAHVVNHPLFKLAFAISLIGLGHHGAMAILLTSEVAISAELVLRNILSFQVIFESRVNQVFKRSPGGNPATYIIKSFGIYPNFALIFPILFLVDHRFGATISCYYLIAQTAVTSLMAVRASLRWIQAIVAA